MKKTFNISIILLSIILVVSCATNKIVSDDLSSNNPLIINGDITCEKFSENEWQINGITKGSSLTVFGLSYKLQHEIRFIINGHDMYLNSEYIGNGLYSGYVTNKFSSYPDTIPINDIRILSNKNIVFDKIEVSTFLDNIKIHFSNLTTGNYSDNYILDKVGITQKKNEITKISFNQIKNLLTDKPEDFFYNYLGRKTALQWKAFWETEEGKEFYNLFINTKNKINNEKISSEISLNIGEYDINKNEFPCTYRDRNEFIIKDSSLKIFENIKVDEDSALTIENLKGGWSNKFTTRINYKVIGLKDNKVEISDVRLDFIKNDDNSIIYSCQLIEDDNTNSDITNNITSLEQEKQDFDFKNMYAQTVIDIFENTIFEVFKTDLEKYDTDLKKKMFLESTESNIYKNKQIVAKKKIIEEGIENTIPNYKFIISNYDTKTNMFYITIGQNYIDKVLYTHNSMLLGPDKTINNFYYDKLPTKNMDGNYCIEWKIKDLNKALEIENQKSNIEIKLNAKIDSIKKISYNRNDIFIDHTDKSSWSVRLPNCTTMKLTVYNSKTNEIYGIFEY